MSSSNRERGRAGARPGAGRQVGVVDEPPASDDGLCTCCEPRNPLVMRPDLGVLGDGSAEFALCVLHEPSPVVYRNRGDGLYLQAPHLALSPAGEIVDGGGDVIAAVAGDSYQRLSTVDDDDEPGDPATRPEPSASPRTDDAARPATHHVDLSQDDFYF